MVLPEGIEPSASPLPRECSTPELRQHELDNGQVRERRGPCHKALGGARRGFGTIAAFLRPSGHAKLPVLDL